VYFVVDAGLLLLRFIQFFSTKPRDWLGRTLPLPLCWVDRKTLSNHFFEHDFLGDRFIDL